MIDLFTGEEVWKVCKQLLMLRKLADREGHEILDSFQVARLLDPDYPENSYQNNNWNRCLKSSARVVPGLELLNDIEVIKISDEPETWPEYKIWDLHPTADKFLKRHDAGKLHAYLLDSKVKSYSMSPGVKR